MKVKGVKVRFGNWDCELKRLQYNNRRTALQLVAWEDQDDVYEGDLIATCTVNIPEIDLEESEVIIKDYSENEGMLNSLLDANVVKLTGKSIQTGFVTCPVCVLN